MRCSKCHRDRKPLRRGLCGNCYEKARARIGFQSSFVDAEPARLHVKELVAAGLSKRQICRLADIRRQDMADLTNGRPYRGTGPCHQILRDKAERILALPLPGATLHHGAAPGQLVPVLGTRRRLQALIALGYTQADLSQRLGRTRGNGGLLLNSQTYVTAAVAQRVENLFNELQLATGPSDRARRYAARRGWVPPLAWDEDTIDDPAAQPDTGAGERASFTDRYTELRELGYNDLSIAGRLGMRLSSLERSLDRAGLTVGPQLRGAARDERRDRIAS